MASSPSKKTVAVVGTGPAGLMCAFVAASHGYEVTLFEKRRGAGRKLLIAGSSGLNITYDCALDEFAAHYAAPEGRMRSILEAFPPEAWIRFIEALGIATFKGTSRRYFVEGMKASVLLKTWQQRLAELGARIEYGRECAGFDTEAEGGVRLRFAEGPDFRADAACFCLGGGSYEPQEDPLRWLRIFSEKGLRLAPFRASNVGYQVAWPEPLLQEAEGKPIKNVVLHSGRGKRSGDLVITSYGIEGTPVYFAGQPGTVHLDLKPDLTEAQIRSKLRLSKENLSPIRRVKRFLALGEGALALLFHLAPREALGDLEAMIPLLKRFPLELKQAQPLAEAISSSGGLGWEALDDRLMLRSHPGVFAAGEMLDWDAPTGGFLIQGCVSQGRLAGQGIVDFLGR